MSPVGAPRTSKPGAWREYALTAGFLAPAAFFLGIWIVYPTRSDDHSKLLQRRRRGVRGDRQLQGALHNRSHVTAIQNNAIWVAVVTALVTAVGLIFGVLTESVRWSVAFKTVVFMPMGDLPLFAAGVTWRIMYVSDPDLGAVSVHSRRQGDRQHAWRPLRRRALFDSLSPTPDGGIELGDAGRGGTGRAARTDRDRRRRGAGGRRAGRQPEALQGGINGVVWRTSAEGSTPGEVERRSSGPRRQHRADPTARPSSRDDGAERHVRRPRVPRARPARIRSGSARPPSRSPSRASRAARREADPLRR